ncbi:SusC/RagA family TonB-linked outer membrane protein [Flavihumibacter petaseus]|uniref:Putative TonB-dependent receptor n=1 Tax=Flavihumibacter petaseus NBRC 106054 TaxID=1220578 RepID=A0A0E9MX77_9BACT|nr:TonB-dependent receptor [Flavihumibacter petaseus]GAO42347.1 putative TonB-dependent receptor [Flavihumibacter petaseus NBRC 106054]
MKSTKTIRLGLLLLWGFYVSLLSSPAFAQPAKVSGVVTKQNAVPVPGATVSVKNTSRSTSADEAGRFTIEAAANDILVITAVGFAPKEAKVGAGTLSIQLLEVNNPMENVVVIGYGQQRKKLVTGANVQVKGEDLQKQNTTNALQALQGQATGVQITSSSGQPGDGFNVIIRGKGTIGNFGPLFVVDGVQGVNPNSINPADIESIDVLKDAASAAIYGSQAANGVILVTTRTGRQNQKAQVTLDAYYGVQNVPRKAQLLDAKEYAIIMNEQAMNSGKPRYFTNEEINNLPVNTNWLDQMFKENVPTQNYVLGVTGGNGGSAYSTSFGYTSQGGIVGGPDISNYERYTVKINSEHKLYKDIIKLGEHLSFNNVNSHGIQTGGQYSNTLRSAFSTTPFLPMYDAEGNFLASDDTSYHWNPGQVGSPQWDNSTSNPYASMYYNSNSRNSSQGLFGDAYLQVEPIKGLTFRTSLGVNYWSNQSRGFTPVYHLSIFDMNDTSTVYQSMGSGRTLQFDNTLSYDFRVGKDHSFNVMAGSSAINTKGSGLSGNNWDLRVADLAHAYLDVAQNRAPESDHLSAGGGPFEDALLSYFGRLQYNYKEKYLFNATFRADGSSKFAPDHRWGYFPSVSAGWIVSREEFAQVSAIDFLKVRASWGRVGNQSVPAYQYLAPISFNQAGYIFGNTEGMNTPGAYPSRLANPNVKWETSEQANIGFDLTLIKRLNVTFDYYVKKTKDWLITAPILATAGADAPLINGGDVQNTGVELALNYRNTIGKNLNYSVGVNGSYNKNKIGNIPTNDHIIHGNTNVLFANSLEFYRAQNGFPVGYFWGLKTAGVFQSEAEVNGYVNKGGTVIQPSAKPGDVRYVDQNGDGVISNDDRIMIGDPNPDFIFGFNVALDYKGFDFMVQGSGVTGNQLVQSWKGPGGRGNYSAEILGRWTGPGTSNRIPRVTEEGTNFAQFSDLYVYDGSFLRINTITLGYDFAGLIKKSYLSRVRFYVSVLNAFTFTKYNGMDPEIGHNEGFSTGVDVGYYPRPRTMMAGANIRF